ncbi:hypothetical protein DSECCO2_384370 [anaerobic digester metagenome]
MSARGVIAARSHSPVSGRQSWPVVPMRAEPPGEADETTATALSSGVKTRPTLRLVPSRRAARRAMVPPGVRNRSGWSPVSSKTNPSRRAGSSARRGVPKGSASNRQRSGVQAPGPARSVMKTRIPVPVSASSIVAQLASILSPLISSPRFRATPRPASKTSPMSCRTVARSVGLCVAMAATEPPHRVTNESVRHSASWSLRRRATSSSTRGWARPRPGKVPSAADATVTAPVIGRRR